MAGPIGHIVQHVRGHAGSIAIGLLHAHDLRVFLVSVTATPAVIQTIGECGINRSFHLTGSHLVYGTESPSGAFRAVHSQVAPHSVEICPLLGRKALNGMRAQGAPWQLVSDLDCGNRSFRATLHLTRI